MKSLNMIGCATLVTVLCLGFVGCEKNNYYVVADDSNQLSGPVLLYGCWMFVEPWPEPLPAYPLDVAVTFLDDNNRAHVARVLLDGTYDIRLPDGIYRPVVESGLGYPDTNIAINVVSDGEMQVQQFTDWVNPDRFVIGFHYQNAADSMGEEQEMGYVKLLDKHADNPLDLDQAVRSVNISPDIIRMWVKYTIPMKEGLIKWQVNDLFYRLMHVYRWSIFPDNMWYDPGWFICLDS
jgi:hypothetical protein